VLFDELYVEEPTPHLPSDIIPLVARAAPSGGRTARPVAYADPAAFAAGPMTKWGRPPSFADEFANAGMPLQKANNDRKAGYVRIAELLKPDPEHAFPTWHPRAGELGSPRLFIVRLHAPDRAAAGRAARGARRAAPGRGGVAEVGRPVRARARRAPLRRADVAGPVGEARRAARGPARRGAEHEKRINDGPHERRRYTLA
jgi:hypothetical protein